MGGRQGVTKVAWVDVLAFAKVVWVVAKVLLRGFWVVAIALLRCSGWLSRCC